jgi:hypothetical protein
MSFRGPYEIECPFRITVKGLSIMHSLQEGSSLHKAALEKRDYLFCREMRCWYRVEESVIGVVVLRDGEQ